MGLSALSSLGLNRVNRVCGSLDLDFAPSSAGGAGAWSLHAELPSYKARAAMSEHFKEARSYYLDG